MSWSEYLAHGGKCHSTAMFCDKYVYDKTGVPVQPYVKKGGKLLSGHEGFKHLMQCHDKGGGIVLHLADKEIKLMMVKTGLYKNGNWGVCIKKTKAGNYIMVIKNSEGNALNLAEGSALDITEKVEGVNY